MKKDNVINLGSVNVPTSWNDVSLKKFSEIERYYSSISGDSKFNVIDVLDILIDKDKDWIMSLPMDFLEKILEKLMFLNEKPEEKEPSNKIEIDGDEYQVNVQDKLKTGEFIAVDTILKTDKYNYAAILAVLCRKKGEIYDSKFENEVLPKRIKMWEETPVVKVMGVVNFFLNLYMVLHLPTLLSSELLEEVNHIRESIKSSRANGDLSALSTKRLMKKLKKLEKSIASI